MENFIFCVVNLSSKYLHKAKKKNTLVQGNVVDEKNLYPGGYKFIFLNQFN